MLTEEMYKDLMETKKQLSITHRALELASEKYAQERQENFKGTIDPKEIAKTFFGLAHAEHVKRHS